MSEFAFLPRLPLAFSQLVMLGALIALGLLAGEAARRYVGLPRITGYVVAGVVLGPQAMGLLDSNALYDLRLAVDLSIGLVVFELGFRLSFDWLRRNRWLFVTAVAESLLCFWAIYAALIYFDFRPLLAAAAAAIGAATSAPVVMLVAQDLRAEGQITERMLLFTAVSTVFAYVALTLLLPFREFERPGADWQPALLYPIYVLAGSAFAGYVASAVLLHLAGWLGKREGRQVLLIVAVVVMAIGVAHSLKLSVPLTLVTFGVLCRNLDRKHHLLPVRFGELGQLFFVILFVVTGASLEFGAFGVAAAGAVAAFVTLRFLGKALALLTFGKLSGIRPGGAGLLAIALLPMSGLAVVMVRDTVSLYPSFGSELAAVVLSAVVVLELIGPLATQFALRRAGEAHPDG